MPEAHVNGVRIHYRAAGEGYPLVLAHGFTGNLRNWALQIPAFTKRYRTISLDHRGHGHSEHPETSYSIETFAEDLYQLLEVLDVTEMYLAGHSMGGYIALEFILTHPEMVKALILVDTGSDILDDPGRRERRVRSRQIVEEEGIEALLEFNLSDELWAETFRENPRILEVYREQFLLNSPQGYLGSADAIAKKAVHTGRLGEIRVPTLVVVGEKDTPFIEPCNVLARSIPDAELVVIPGVGHSPQIEDAQTFNSAVLTFLEKVESRPG